ncbi:S8 family serine peptidase [Rathayibacter sp. VKM Ac-2760]|uniref:S8 family serine peptidase n=1 Tax=Rathayibacter sp. VKM Ac-2760 TaxID=2609253 RepID=UPI001316316B|nr:S8 family serine peptidase [Rathayibacter sp. VKM Ac-2760]QHC59681.1 S8 family serine peptidase [Rathayibacter sp. VKM Ac-2760]
MPFPLLPRPGVRRAEQRLLAGLAVLGLAAAGAFTLSGASAAPLPGGDPVAAGLAPQQEFDDGDYVVTLVEPSAAVYEGTDARFARTAPEPGSQLQPDSSPVEDYSAHLEHRQEDVADAVDAEIGYHYSVALNGFSAVLTGDQARALAGRKDVAQVEKVEDFHLDLAEPPAAPIEADAAETPVPDSGQESSTSFLGLVGPGGVWEDVGGVDQAGAGVVVGVIDSGIAPENPSFAGAPLATAPGPAPFTEGDTVTYRKSDGGLFVGSCSPGLAASAQWQGDECNQKLIGARWFHEEGESAGSPDHPDYLSPRDGVGHGSHTASTAAGDAGVEATVDGRDYGTVSGVAPAAKIAAYKVCWNGPKDGIDDDHCSSTSILAAIEAAVADGVDVINYSIGGRAAESTFTAIDRAFLNAAAAGVFVAAAAGNTGPTASTLDHASPWYTTVGASSIPNHTATATLGDGRAFAGGSITVHGDVTGPLVNGADVTLAATTTSESCATGTLDPAKVAGTIVACTAGLSTRVSKSLEVHRAGGIGMLLLNPVPNGMHLDPHSVPSIQIDSGAYAAITAYAGTAGATVTLSAGDATGTSIPAPQVGGFSARGPAEADGADVLKPDVVAPGVGILAASLNAEGDRPAFAFQSGTSMASPHVAGLAALLLGVTPRASPSAVKSALMTTASDTVDQAGAPSQDVFAQGAGQVDPAGFLDPGLLYETGPRDWAAFLRGSGHDLEVLGSNSIDPSDLNQPSIAIGALDGTQTVTRTVTSTGPGSYTAALDVPGVDTVVSPSTLSFTAAGQTAEYTVSFSRTDAAFTRFATGYLIWTSDAQVVRTPVAVRPVLLEAQDEASGTGSAGSVSVAVRPGFTGALPLTPHGLTEGVLAKDPSSADGHSGTLAAGKRFATTIEIPPGTEFARFDLDGLDDEADIDLTVSRLVGGRPMLAAFSISPSADERVDLVAPQPGSYRVVLDAFDSGADPVATYDLRSFVIPKDGGAGSLSTTPTVIAAEVGQPTHYAVSWTGLTGPAKYLGRIGYADSEFATLLSVDVPAAAAPDPAGTATPSPTEGPTSPPTAEPSPVPTGGPTAEPTSPPTGEPSPVPTDGPTSLPTAAPSPVPTGEPTSLPTPEPSPVPTGGPTSLPTAEPAPDPTAEPSPVPTAEPTSLPTVEPTSLPTAEPTSPPAVEPTSPPAPGPTPAPTAGASVAPVAAPTAGPTDAPSAGPIALSDASPPSAGGSGAPARDPGGLPSTGWSGGLLGLGASVLIAVGAVLTGLRRRAIAQRRAASAE